MRDFVVINIELTAMHWLQMTFFLQTYEIYMEIRIALQFLAAYGQK